MTKVAVHKRLWPLALGLLALLAVLLLRPGGIGGTGIGDDNGGIGGTGINTGFIGRIDGFGSIIVNGEHISYADDLPIDFNSRTGLARELKIGQIVQVLAAPGPDGSLEAISVRVRHAVIGTLENSLGETVTVGGQNVVVPTGLSLPPPGGRVAVSGFRRADGVIIASRIDPAADSPDSNLPSPHRPFDDKTARLSLSGFVQIDAGALYGYRLENLPATINPARLATINLAATPEGLKLVSVSQRPEAPEKAPAPPPQKPQPINNPQEPGPIRVQTNAQEQKPKAPQIKPQKNTAPKPDQPEIGRPPVRPEPRSTLPPAPPEVPLRDTPLEKERGLDEAQDETLEQQPDQQPEPQPEPDAPENLGESEDPVRGDTPTRGTTPPARDIVTPDTPEQPETDRPERPEPVRPDRPERTERPERVERPEKPERPERPDRPRR